MCAAGFYLPVPQDNDAVCLPHGGDALGDDELCGLRSGRVQCSVQVRLRFQVKGTGGIVENEDLSGLQHGSGNG